MGEAVYRRVEGLLRWVAEQHESECGPHLGQSWVSLLIREHQNQAEAAACV